MKRIIFTKLAERELKDAIRYYEVENLLALAGDSGMK